MNKTIKHHPSLPLEIAKKGLEDYKEAVEKEFESSEEAWNWLDEREAAMGLCSYFHFKHDIKIDSQTIFSLKHSFDVLCSFAYAEHTLSEIKESLQIRYEALKNYIEKGI